MAIDYYRILDVPRQASAEEIKKMYRRQALIYHPDRNSSPGASERFNEITEAYLVLSNEKRRKLFDRFGREDIKCTSNSSFSFSSCFRDKDVARKIFTDVFTNCEKKSDLIDDLIELRMNAGKRRASTGDIKVTPFKRRLIQDPPIYKDLPVTLEEVNAGCTKRMKITKLVLDPNQVSSRKVEKILTIDIKPGSKEGTTIIFPKEGDEHFGVIPADIVFVLKDHPHESYQRDSNNNLIHTKKINLREALIGDKPLEVPTLTQGKKLLFHAEGKVINPKSVKIFPGEGLPLPEQSGKFGNLILNFDIMFPDEVNAAQKNMLKTILI